MNDLENKVVNEYNRAIAKYPGIQNPFQIFGYLQMRFNEFVSQLVKLSVKGSGKPKARALLAVTVVQLIVLLKRFYEDNLAGEFKQSDWDALYDGTEKPAPVKKTE